MTRCFPANLWRQSVRPDSFTLFIFLLVSPGGRKSHLQELCFSARPLKKLGLNEEKNLPHICTYTLPLQGCIRLVLAASTLCRQGSGMMELERCFLCPDLQLFVCKAPAKSYPRSRRVQSAGGKKRGEKSTSHMANSFARHLLNWPFLDEFQPVCWISTLCQRCKILEMKEKAHDLCILSIVFYQNSLQSASCSGKLTHPLL